MIQYYMLPCWRCHTSSLKGWVACGVCWCVAVGFGDVDSKLLEASAALLTRRYASVEEFSSLCVNTFNVDFCLSRFSCQHVRTCWSWLEPVSLLTWNHCLRCFYMMSMKCAAAAAVWICGGSEDKSQEDRVGWCNNPFNTIYPAQWQYQKIMLAHSLCVWMLFNIFNWFPTSSHPSWLGGQVEWYFCLSMGNWLASLPGFSALDQ